MWRGDFSVCRNDFEISIHVQNIFHVVWWATVVSVGVWVVCGFVSFNVWLDVIEVDTEIIK